MRIEPSRCRLMEVASVLSWNQGVFILLQSANDTEFAEAMKDMNIEHLSMDFVKKLLKRRIYS